MRLVSGWKRMMRQSLTLAAKTGRDSYGNETHSTSPATYRCRLVGKRQMVRTAEGQELASNWMAYLMTEAAVSPDALVTLSTGDVGSTETHAVHPPILSVGRYPADNGGFHHTVLFF